MLAERTAPPDLWIVRRHDPRIDPNMLLMARMLMVGADETIRGAMNLERDSA